MDDIKDHNGISFDNITYTFDPEAIAESSTRKIQFSIRIPKDVEKAFNVLWALEQVKTPLVKLHRNQAFAIMVMKQYKQMLAKDNPYITNDNNKVTPIKKPKGYSLGDIVARGEEI